MIISKASFEARPPETVMILAGEASGDLHGANLVKAMKRLRPSLSFAGIGGHRMEEAGVGLLVHSSDIAVVGLTEVLHRGRILLKALSDVKDFLRRKRPALLILIDFPDFNIHVAATAKRCGVPVLYFISPQVWAWRRGRIRKIWRRIERMAVILPFEEAFYRRHGVQVDYVGHPILDSLPDDLPRPASLDWAMQDSAPVVGLVPGSREEEILNLLPVMLRAAERLRTRYPRLECLLPLARSVRRELVADIVGSSSVPVQVSTETLPAVLARCHAAMVTSGTATLETALVTVPMVVLYRVSPVSYWAGRLLIKVPFISLVNLVAGEEVVKELIQKDAEPERIRLEVQRLLDDEAYRAAVIRGLKEVRRRLGQGGASGRAARIALLMLDEKREGR